MYTHVHNISQIVYLRIYSDGMLCYRINAFSMLCMCMYMYAQVHTSYFMHSEICYFSTCNA